MANTAALSLIFDLDNTLINRDAAFYAYVLDFIQRNQNALNNEEPNLVLKEILKFDQNGTKDRQVFCKEVLQRFQGLAYTEESLWLDHLSVPNFVSIDKVVIALLERLAHTHQLILLSNGSGNMQRRKLKQAGIEAYFEHVFISAEVGYAKPNPKIFTHALKHCRHHTIVMIGDNYLHDIQTAIEMNLKTIFINPRKIIVPIAPDHDIPNIYQLEEVISCLI
jgi:HAD superfamily hydrolase (TIGR01549 family)